LRKQKGIAIKTSIPEAFRSGSGRRAAADSGASQSRQQRHQVYPTRAASRSASKPTNGEFHITVRDTGPGNRAADQPGSLRNSSRSTTVPRARRAARDLDCRSSRPAGLICHGGPIALAVDPRRSAPPFSVILPVRVDEQKTARGGP
jgi:hypothetical protein